VGDASDDTLDFTSTSLRSINYINAGAGNDAVTIDNYNIDTDITVQGDNGNDTLTLKGSWTRTQSKVRLEGGSGSDTYHVSGPAIINEKVSHASR